MVNTGDDEEDPGPPGSTLQQTTQSEDDGSLVLLDITVRPNNTTGFSKDKIILQKQEKSGPIFSIGFTTVHGYSLLSILQFRKFQ